MTDQPTPSDAERPGRCSFDDAHPVVYGYLLRRCGSVELAEDLTAATFVTALGSTGRTEWAVPWLIVVARNKLIDHWRRASQTENHEPQPDAEDHARSVVEAVRIGTALNALSLDHRLAMVLRYLDDLPVAAVADEMGRSVRATESLLVRARQAFRDSYGPTGEDTHD